MTGYNVELKPGLAMPMTKLGFANEISVDLKSTHETVAGFDAMYQLSKK